MNSHITTFLNRYITYENPQFAVMLSGEWGCGKTHFIKSWIKAIQDQKGSSIKPIYISLFGIHSITEVREGINRQLHPILTSTSVKNLKKVANGVAKTVLKCDFSDKSKPVEVSYELDLLTLFQTDDKDIKATGKILIFDDLERCYINKIELLGFINYFVEHCGCKVIVLCHEEKMTKLNHVHTIIEDKSLKQWIIERKDDSIEDKDYKEFKEKTIAFTFEVKPDIEEAIRYFILEEIQTDPQQVMTKMVPYLKRMLEMTKNKNMRIVRQCLLDFSSIVKEVSNDLYTAELYIPIMQKLLFDMMIIYLETKANNPLFNDIEELKHSMFPRGNRYDSFIDLKKKYSPIPDSLKISILDFSNIEIIVNYIRKGLSFAKNIEQQVLYVEKEQQPWEILTNYWNLSNEEFRTCYALTEKKLKSREIDNLEDLLTIAFRLYVIEYQGIRSVSKIFERDVNYCFKQIANKCITNQNEFYSFKSKLNNSLYRYSLDNESFKWDNVIKFMQSYLNDLEGKFKSEMTTMLETFTFKDLNMLYNMVDSLDPETRLTYDRCPMFHKVNPTKVVNCIMQLNNKERETFRSILSHHYTELRFSNYDEFKSYEGERENVTRIVELLKKKRLTEIDKYSVNSIIKQFEEFLLN